MLSWKFLIWLLGAFLAISTLVSMCRARRATLEQKLVSWLTTELGNLRNKRRLLLRVRKRRAELKAREEVLAAAAEAQIAELNISSLMGDKPK